MSLYTPPAFREDRPEVLLRLMRTSRLPLLISNGANGLPDVTHLPLLTDGVRIVGHLARANPHWKALRDGARAIAIFPGPEGYISPSSYASKAEHHRVVPTWNYEAVHAEGPIEIIEDAARLHEIVSTLTDHHEKPRAERWKVGDAPAEFIAGQLKGIVGVVLTIEALIGKRKLSQNRPAADRDGALEDVDQHNAGLAEAMRAARDGN
ncbi:FMN-binding negative transcriptional regulator [Sediminicoccus sp. KRV36]|uniref:FMN-binding negative transcriptional regulator n=1 Tax=Sediminicoccus sp. KRV36 TaxID=3133721 RepID=UPI00200FF1BA|nr:FMN-binding negative transcriptional regulator [Sediminicoccus rosea]UPY37297.1 FMN-binding negative transcriptional regulator [Sediminicoccus rosea]